jgi:alkylation response protein AidB-like acyl-CoA dehydrogenase
MQKYLIDFRDLQFTLFEFLEVDKMSSFSRYGQFERADYEETIRLAGRIAAEQVFPVNVSGHREGCRYDPKTKSVFLPSGYKNAARSLIDAGFLSISDDPEIGGTGMPMSVQTCAWEVLCGAGGSLMLFMILGHGAAMLIQRFGTDEQKNLYVPKLLTGEWGGTMCLTEPEAGSDVGALKTRAVLQPDGTYKITGQKCFISNGEQDITKQIIYPVLARVEGDRPGTKGISLFIVPKYLLSDDGTPGERNDVYCIGIEKKMGAHGAATCSMAFGENGGCKGYLLGERGRGMNIMFQMLNETRLEVGIMALGGASAAFMLAVNYARTRLQGPHVTRLLDPSAPQVPIIEHPDVMRMLLWMQACIGAERMLTYYVSKQIDLQHLLDGEAKDEARALVELLIPLVKSGNTDNTWLITSEAIQVHGGYGYCSDFNVEQFAVDCKALCIVEGTNGIQSLDLVMRKILLNPGHYNYQVLKSRMQRTITESAGIVDAEYREALVKGITVMDSAIEHLKGLMESGDYQALLINVDPLRKAFFELVLSWMHIWCLMLVKPRFDALTEGMSGDSLAAAIESQSETAFYYGKMRTSEFWLATEFPKYFGKMDAIFQSARVALLAGNSVFASLPSK